MENGMQSIGSYEELVGLFRESGLAHEAVPADSAVTIPTSKGPLEGVMFVRWQDDQKVVHFLQTMGFEIPQGRMAAMALAIALLNHALVLPGFGINVNSHSCYYRFSMPLRADGTLTKQEIQGLFNLGVRNASEHITKLRAVAEGGADPATVLQAASGT